jgi:hypothetical protein
MLLYPMAAPACRPAIREPRGHELILERHGSILCRLPSNECENRYGNKIYSNMYSGFSSFHCRMPGRRPGATVHAWRIVVTFTITIMRTLLFAVLFGMLLMLNRATAAEEGWKRVENGSFSFSVPSTFKKTEAHGTDSFVEEYVDNNIKLSFDYGIFSNNFGDWPEDTKFEDVKTGGKAARIGTVAHEFHPGFPYASQIRINLEEGVALSMFAACKSEKEAALARKIFESIEFKSKEG